VKIIHKTIFGPNTLYVTVREICVVVGVIIWMDRTCSTHGIVQKVSLYTIFVGTPEEKMSLADLGIDGRIIINLY
jgi:hypothetical protein